MTIDTPADPGSFKHKLDQMTQQLVAVERRAQTLAELNRLLSQGRDPLALAQRAVDLVMRATGAAGSFVYLWDRASERLVLRAASAGRQAAYVGQIELRLGEGVTGWAGLMRQTVVLDDETKDDPRFVPVPVLEEEGLRSMVAVPIVVPGSELLGVFTLWSAEPAAFKNHAVDLATEVGGLLASGLVHSQTLDDLRRQSTVARFLLSLPVEVTSSLQRCVDILAESIRDQADATLCTIELAGRGTSDGNIKPGIAFGGNVDKSVVAASRAIRSRADLTGLIQKLGPGLEKFTTSFGSLYPLGAVTCYRERPFTETDHNIVESLAGQAGALIASLSSPAMAIPLAGRLLSASGAAAAERTLRDLGWRPGPTLPVLARIRSTRYVSPASFDRVASAFQQMTAYAEDVIWVPSAPTVSILIRHQSKSWSGFEQALRNALQDSWPILGDGISIGIGPVSHSVLEIGKGLEKAESALAWAELLDESIPIVDYEDIEHLRLLPKVALSIGGEVRDIVNYFTILIRYDLRHGTALATTLDAYLVHRGSATDTASHLFIHRNTLRQRLTRIEELIGRPVNQIGDWTVAALASRLASAAEAEA